MIDLRSDTVTKPTEDMRRAIANAEVGDDVLGDDPTVKKLEEQTAAILGKEAAVFMPSGTMTNQVAIRTHTQPGDEILLEANSHIYYYEAGAPAALAGVSCNLIHGERGIFSAEILQKALRPANIHFPPSKLVCIENTHNRGGGSIWPIEMIMEINTVAREHNLKLHLDGARIWNATAATGISEKDYAAPFDSVSVCFSKGLGAPVGSALAGSQEFIARARRFRKQFGGAMRQAGIIAAAALFALDKHRERLAEDNANARTLAKAICNLPNIRLDTKSVETNIVVFELEEIPAYEFAEKLYRNGVHVLATGPKTIRAVTNLNVSHEQILTSSSIIKNTLSRNK